MAVSAEQKKMHHEIKYVGLRAQATAAGLVQMCKELHAAGVLNQDAMNRVKSAIADEIVLAGPRQAMLPAYRIEVNERLNRIFAGKQNVSEGAIPPYDECEED